MALKRGFMLVIGLLLTAGCFQIEMHDVSSEPKYSRLIGEHIRLREHVWATAITSDQDYAKSVDYIVLVPGVGFTGPEVISRSRIAPGAEYEIVRVLSGAPIAASRVAYVVQRVGAASDGDVPIRIKVPGDLEGQNLGLDRATFEAIERP